MNSDGFRTIEIRKLADVPGWLTVGVMLHTSCNDTTWGPVTRIGVDPNKRVVIDFEFKSSHLSEFIDCHNDIENPPPNLASIDVPEGTCTLRDVPILKAHEDDDAWHTIVLATPGDGCYRCSSLFQILPTAPSASVNR